MAKNTILQTAGENLVCTFLCNPSYVYLEVILMKLNGTSSMYRTETSYHEVECNPVNAYSEVNSTDLPLLSIYRIAA